MNEIKRNTDPLKGPPDWVEAEIKCNVASMQAINKRGDKPVHPTIMNCKIFGSYNEGTLGLSIKGIGRIINLRMDEVMALLKAAAEASLEFQATLPVYTDEELEEKWRELSDVPFDEADSPSPSGLILAKAWWVFPKGTDREDIWRYFDERHSRGVDYLLYEFDSVQ